VRLTEIVSMPFEFGVAVKMNDTAFAVLADGATRVAAPAATEKSEKAAFVVPWIAMVQMIGTDAWITGVVHVRVEVELGNRLIMYVMGDDAIKLLELLSVTEIVELPIPLGNAVNVNDVVLCAFGDGVVSDTVVAIAKSEKREFAVGLTVMVQTIFTA